MPDTLTLTANDNNSKHKTSSLAASLAGALKSAIGNIDLISGNNDSTIKQILQPKLVEQLGWDEPDVSILKRTNFDDGTSIWGDPIELMSVPVKKWTNGTKSALTNSTNIILQQQQQPTIKKTISTSNSSAPMMFDDENWPQQQSSTIIHQSTSQWNDPSSTVTTNLDQTNSSQQPNYRQHQAGWNSTCQSNENWLDDGVIDTSQWDLSRPSHKVPFDPYDGQVDTTDWDLHSVSGMARQLPIARSRFMNEYDLNEHSSHDIRMSGYDSQSMNNPYRQNTDVKSQMMNLSNILPPNHPSFSPRPSPGALYPRQPGNILRPMNPNSGLSTPSGAVIGQNSHLSPKLPIPSPTMPTNQSSYVSLAGKQGNIPNPSSQTSNSSQQQTAGSGSNNNNGAVHAQIMQQFRLAVQAGLISQDLLNTKLPPYMLQVEKTIFSFLLMQRITKFSLHIPYIQRKKYFISAIDLII